jgi:UDP-N-acetylglucosamine--N-acetylmuramyl-(pentapeptide) pyrophosphoryl-undecaprenol N-acetylglucosamine transferase
MRKIRVIISGGGTGGHIFPALAIANELKNVNNENEILFVGAEGRMEMEKVPAAGYKIEGLKISGIQRKISLSNLALPFKILSSVLKAHSIIKEFKPDVAIGVGGYASGPLLFAATSKNIPSLIQEQNSYAGVTNKLLSNRVRKICVAYEGMEKYFPKAKIVRTGNPVRSDIKQVSEKREEALKYFQLVSGRPTVLIVGGSLGAVTINKSIKEGLHKFIDQQVQVIWQTGKSYYSQIAANNAIKPTDSIRIFDFINRMDLAYSAADVVISRAGASSVSELEIVGKPAILVPSPNVAEDHQTKNAMALVNKDAATLVKDSDASIILVDTAIALTKDSYRQKVLSTNISHMAKPDAAADIVKEIYNLL